MYMILAYAMYRGRREEEEEGGRERKRERKDEGTWRRAWTASGSLEEDLKSLLRGTPRSI